VVRTLLGGERVIFWENNYNKIELINVNSVLRCLYDVDDVANISEVHAASIFGAVVCTMCELLFIAVYTRLFGSFV
jgi:hypothetical protein